MNVDWTDHRMEISSKLTRAMWCFHGLVDEWWSFERVVETMMMLGDVAMRKT